MSTRHAAAAAHANRGALLAGNPDDVGAVEHDAGGTTLADGDVLVGAVTPQVRGLDHELVPPTSAAGLDMQLAGWRVDADADAARGHERDVIVAVVADADLQRALLARAGVIPEPGG